MSLLTFIGRLLLKTREKSVSKFIENPLLHQKKTLKDLINQGASSFQHGPMSHQEELRVKKLLEGVVENGTARRESNGYRLCLCHGFGCQWYTRWCNLIDCTT